MRRYIIYLPRTYYRTYNIILILKIFAACNIYYIFSFKKDDEKPDILYEQSYLQRNKIKTCTVRQKN